MRAPLRRGRPDPRRRDVPRRSRSRSRCSSCFAARAAGARVTTGCGASARWSARRRGPLDRLQRDDGRAVPDRRPRRGQGPLPPRRPGGPRLWLIAARTDVGSRPARPRAGCRPPGLAGSTVMAKQRSRYVCRECGHESLAWSGQCPGCSEWNTLEEVVVTATTAAGAGPLVAQARRARRARSRCATSRRRPRSASAPASASSTACSAAGSFPARSSCSAARRGSARARSPRWRSATSPRPAAPSST